MKRVLPILLTACAVLLGSAGVSSETNQNVSDSRTIFLKLLKNPEDLQLNILYAKDCEERGKFNLAIVTYQRMIFLDPNNKQWKDNIE